MPKIEAYTRAQIEQFLPLAIKRALGSYRKFTSSPISQESKEFKARHDACKVAISHIQLLVKLAQWVDLPDKQNGKNGISQAKLSELIENANLEIETHNNSNNDNPNTDNSSSDNPNNNTNTDNPNSNNPNNE